MTKILGGEVTYERSVKVADYENKKASVKLTFGIEEGTPAAETSFYIAQVTSAARDHVEGVLGLKKIAVAPPVKAETVPAPAAAPTDKDKLAAAAAKPAEAPKPVRARAPRVVEQAKESEPAKPAPAVDPLADLNEDFGADPATAAPITDKELSEHCSAINGKIKNPVLIRQLIGKYTGPKPANAQNIPAESRAKFVAELKTLQPAAA